MAFITDKEELKPGLIIFRRGDVAQAAAAAKPAGECLRLEFSVAPQQADQGIPLNWNWPGQGQGQGQGQGWPQQGGGFGLQQMLLLDALAGGGKKGKRRRGLFS